MKNRLRLRAHTLAFNSRNKKQLIGPIILMIFVLLSGIVYALAQIL